MGKGKGMKCSVKKCPSLFFNSACKGVRFFRFPNPKQKLRVMQWKLACGREDIMDLDPAVLYRNHRVCSLHFESDLTRNFKLNCNAIPTLNLFQNPRIEEHNYCRDGETMEVAHYIEIETVKEFRCIATQTDDEKHNLYKQHSINLINVGTQTDTFQPTIWNLRPKLVIYYLLGHQEKKNYER